MKKAIFLFGLITILLSACNQKDEKTHSTTANDTANTAAIPDGDSVTVTHKMLRKTYNEIMARKQAFLNDPSCKLTDVQITAGKSDYVTWVTAKPNDRIFTHLTLDMGTLNSISSDYAAIRFEPAYLNGEPTVLLEGYDQYGMMVICRPIKCLFDDPDNITKTGVFCPPPAGCPPTVDSLQPNHSTQKK